VRTQDLRCILEDIYEGKLSVSAARHALKTLREKGSPYPPFVIWLGVIVISVAFAIDIAGTWEAVLWAALTSMVTGLVFLASDRIAEFSKISPLVGTLASGVIVMGAYKLGWVAEAPGLLLIASTFVFIPGDSISIQAYELAGGRWSAGVDRLFYSLITLLLQATGAYLAIIVTGTAVGELFPATARDIFPWWAIYPSRFLLVLGVLLAFQMSWRQFPRALITLWAVTIVGQVSSMAYGEVSGTFVAAAVGMVLSIWQSRKPRSIPAYVLMIPVVFALSPGSHGLRQLETWISGQTITGIQDLSTMFAILSAIAMGMVVGSSIIHRWRWISREKTKSDLTRQTAGSL